MIGAGGKLNLSIDTSVAGWNLTCFDSNQAFIGGQNASVPKVCENGIQIKNYVKPAIRTGMFQRKDELPSTGSGAWLWHVCDRTNLASPETADLWTVSSIVLLGRSTPRGYKH